MWLVACAIALDGPFNDTTTAPIPIENGKIYLTRWDTAATGITLRFGSISDKRERTILNKWNSITIYVTGMCISAVTAVATES